MAALDMCLLYINSFSNFPKHPVTYYSILNVTDGDLCIQTFSKYFCCRSRTGPGRFITVSNTEYCTSFTQIDL